MTNASNWEDLRKQARQLENEIDLKLVSFSKHSTANPSITSDSDTSPLLGSEHIFDTLSLEIEQMLKKLTTLNDHLAEAASAPGSSSGQLHTLQRHREILSDYSQEFTKTRDNYRSRREREELLGSVNSELESFKSSSGLNRRMELYLKENEHIRNSDRLIDEQIAIALDTRDHLNNQRVAFKRIQTRMNDFANRFPAIGSLMQRIHAKKRKDSIVLGMVIGICTILVLLYIFH